MEHKFAVAEGDNLLDIAQANDLEMEGELVFRYTDRSSNAPLGFTHTNRRLRRILRVLDVPRHCRRRRPLQPHPRAERR